MKNSIFTLLPLCLFLMIQSCKKKNFNQENVQHPFDEINDLNSENSNEKALVKHPISATSDNGNDGNVSQNTIDNNLSTRWSSFGTNKYIQYDLGSVKNISTVKIAWYNGNTRRAKFLIQIGNSTSSLVTVFGSPTNQSSGTTNNLETYKLPANLSGRYIRIVCYGNNLNNWNSITETQVWGNSTITYPYNLGLNRWKITLPRSLDGNSIADEVFRNVAYNDYSGDPSFMVYSDQFFNLTSTNKIRFRCPASNSTPKTYGSSNSRTELREMPDNDDELGWDATTSTLKELKFKVRVVKTSSTKKFAFAQIHDFEQSGWDDILRVQVESDNSNATSGNGKIYLMGDIIEDGGSSSTQYQNRIIKNNYTIGSWITVKITVQNSTVKVYLDNMTTPIRTYFNVDCESNYFKAGVYNQSMNSSSSGEGVAEFEYITVSDNF